MQGPIILDCCQALLYASMLACARLQTQRLFGAHMQNFLVQSGLLWLQGQLRC